MNDENDAVEERDQLRLEVTDLTAKLEAMTQERNEVRLRRQETINMAVQLELEIEQLRGQLAAAQATIARDNKARDARRDDLRWRLDQITAQEQEIQRLRLALSYLAALGGGNSEGNYYAKAALRKALDEGTKEAQ